MDIKRSILGVMSILLGCSLATAGDIGAIASPHWIYPVVSLQGGYASMNAVGNTQRFTGTDLPVFTYLSSGSDNNTGFIGGFLGAEHPLSFISHPGFFMQAGVEYNYFGKVRISGENTVGIEPQTQTKYQYKFNFQTQQILGMLKLFATSFERFHPYGEVGLGAALNHAGQYNATTSQTGLINLTPQFSDQNKTQLSYGWGLGAEIQVNTKTRVGLGYRYSNFGTLSLGNGTVNNHPSFVPFVLSSSNTEVNQLIVRISYLS